MAPLTPRLNLDGYTPLPPGKIAAVVTYLEMRAPPAAAAPACGQAWSLERITDIVRYRTLFRRVGEPWLWFSRLLWPEQELAALLADPQVEAYALRAGAQDVGFLELDFRQGGQCELAFLGLVEDVIGQGAGRYLIGEATRRAFARPIERLFVHTCTLDHPSALRFYRRAGFIPYQRSIEVADDPRLIGLAPISAAPHCPVLR